MKKLSFIIFLFIIISIVSKAQQPKTDSILKKNSAGIEFTCVPHFISELGNGYPIFPEFELQYQRKICPKLFLSIGIVYPYEFDDYWGIMGFEYYLPSSYNKGDIKIRGGVDFKFRIKNKFYFSPSLDAYWIKENYLTFSNPRWQEYEMRRILSVGPDLQFEFRSKRISIELSLLAFSYGLSFPLNKYHKTLGYPYNHPTTWQQSDITRLHKVFSLGVHYNF